MILTNYHTHFSICDGRGEAEDYVRAALDRGFAALGFSSHAPLPYPNGWTMKEKDLPRYFAEVGRLREAYRGRIEIYLGLEVDYIPLPDGTSRLSWTGGGLDYTIGSMHIIPGGPEGYREVDYTEDVYRAILEEDFGGDIRAFAAAYYRSFGELAVRHRPTVLGHFDLIKKNNPVEKYFRENDDWYRRTVEGVIPAVAASGCIVEVNTGGLARGRTSTVYPSPWILRLLREAEVPVMLNSDAHTPENLDARYPEAREIILDAGYREVMTLRADGWKRVPVA